MIELQQMKKIKKIKSGFLDRHLFAAKTLIKVLPDLIPSRLKGPEQLLKSIVGKNLEHFIDEISSLKGPALKAAQMLTVYGEYYLPPELNNILKQIQARSYFLEWDNIKSQVPKDLAEKFIIDPNPIAAASIGQVHKAKRISNDEVVALKIQYPKVDKAIDVDLGILKMLLSFSKVIPGSFNMDKIFAEIKIKLIEEMNYKNEAERQILYKQKLKNLPGVYVPNIYRDDCREKILVQEYIDGMLLSSPQILQKDQEYRNTIAKKLLELFFHEIYVIGMVQSDAHAGNYLITETEDHKPLLILIDFGACVTYEKSALDPYLSMIESIFRKDKEAFLGIFSKIEERAQGNYQIDRDLLYEYFALCASPLHSCDFDWGNCTLPDEVYEMGMKLFKKSKIDNPPHEYIFIDRKIAGLFSLMKMLKARFNVLEIVSPYINSKIEI